ncbi:MAG TPA: four helix bundle protein [Ruminococcaceae bacterium]|nr:four helix bundle protein [uncultured Ruminococcus sp.]HBE14707.1 four helix bundle protein [Oscillospiraceae bacterium]
MSEGITYQKSKLFAVRIVKLYRYLCENKKEYVLSKQLLKCGTSIGANIAEANCAFSKKDFLAKMYIAFKECAETEYWLELLFESGIINDQEFQSMIIDCREIKKLLSSVTKTSKERKSE